MHQSQSYYGCSPPTPTPTQRMMMMGAINVPPQLSLSHIRQKNQPRRMLIALCTIAIVSLPVSAFRNVVGNGANSLAFHGARPLQRRIHGESISIERPTGTSASGLNLGFHTGRKTYSPLLTGMSNTNVEELESLRRMRKSTPTPSPAADSQNKDKEQSSPNSESDSSAKVKVKPQPHTAKKQKSTNNKNNSSNDHPNNANKPTIKSILNKHVGELTTSNLNSLCMSIRHNRKGTSFSQLKILERVLLELDCWVGSETTPTTTTYLKPIHVFAMLTALSNDIRELKRKQPGGAKRRKNNNHQNNNNNNKNNRGKEKISGYDIQRLVQVVTLLSQQRHSNSIDGKCYTKDVPSFATMIAAEASRWESSAVDASLLFLDMVEKEEGDAVEWDPRLVGAVLDALARAGRAEEARMLLGRALGIDLPKFDSGSINENNEEGGVSSAVSSSSKRLNPSRAGPCYNALLRAYSKQALMLAKKAMPDNSRKVYPNAKRKNAGSALSNEKITLAKSSMAQARHILLNHMLLQPELTLTNRTCTAVLQGYSSLGLGAESKGLLLELEALNLKAHSSVSSKEPSQASLDVACYNAVLHACSQSQDSGDVLNAEKLYMAMKEQSPLKIAVENSAVKHVDTEEDTPSLSMIPPQPDYISFSSMLNCYSKHGMVSKAEAVLDGMHEHFQPNVACYLPILQALERSSDDDAASRAASWIERSQQTLARPNRLLYTTALRCMAKHGRGQEAEVLLDKFHDAFPNYGAPDVYSHILVLRAWERTKFKGDRQMAAERAEIFFDKMEQMADDGILPRLDANAYNILLNCYARAGDAEKAINVLTDLEGTSSASDVYAADVRPNSKSYSMVIKALSNSDLPNDQAVAKARRIMYRLGYPKEAQFKLPLEDKVPFNVSINNFNSVLKLFGKRGMAAEAEALLNMMDELIVEGTLKTGHPDIQSYEAVLEALGRCKDSDAPARAEALMTRLEVMSEMGGDSQPKPSLLAYNTLLNCYANAGMAGKAERLLERLDDPDLFSIGSTIKAIANSGKSRAVSITRADSLATTLGAGKANGVIFAHRLSLCAKFGQGELAEQLIQQMEEQNLHPSIRHYTSAMNSWAKNTDDNATSQAEALFKRMADKFDLDLAAYHGLLLNYSARGKKKQARRLLQKIQDSPNVEPNRNSFTMVMDAYARSKSKNAGQKAEELLDEMRKLQAAGNRDVEPDTVTYASLIRCKQTSKNKKINEMTTFEKLQLMQGLQIESWPFEQHDQLQ